MNDRSGSPAGTRRAENGSYQAVRLIRFELEFWDRTPLEDQENDFGRHKASGAPMGKEHEHDDRTLSRIRTVTGLI